MVVLPLLRALEDDVAHPRRGRREPLDAAAGGEGGLDAVPVLLAGEVDGDGLGSVGGLAVAEAAPRPALGCRSLAKGGRGIGLSVVTVFHHITDVAPTSDVMSLIRESGIVHVFRQDKSDDAAAAVKLFGLPGGVAEELAMLDQGVHVLKVGKEPPALISHVRTPLEEWLTDTDAAMLGHGPGEAAPFTDLPAATDATDADVEETRRR